MVVLAEVVSYMPPEQVEGMLVVDEKRAIFSLAVVLRQALTGINVFWAERLKNPLIHYKGPKDSSAQRRSRSPLCCRCRLDAGT